MPPRPMAENTAGPDAVPAPGAAAGQDTFSLRVLITRRWLWPTCLILLGMAGLAQLGLWQLDRLAWRRAENERIRTQWEAPPLLVHELLEAWPPEDLHDRRAYAIGTFDYDSQVGIKNRFYQMDIGIHLFTPLHLSGSDQVLMVNRGWIPQSAAETDWRQFDESAAEVEIAGLLQASASLSPEARRGQPVPVPADGLWHREDLTALDEYLDMSLVPMFLLQAPDASPAGNAWPRREAQHPELSEGNHFSYALQWFSFSLILGTGYVLLVRQRTGVRSRPLPASDQA